ncbi:MAG: UDP-N-acetylmuramoylalanyl-D-glutamyl-2, 6-diaminopimelate--D-alanyl-D-alanine ligase [Bdellovibrio sp. ArHS]|uniref:UDP-N-acetylmuramoyl-tripeptide--D-alanyl-D- alanine ligase n=1 Tax=Bdellovibrio sp. ArHS TaxID=1569284 RepID=UPI000583A55C|nr:UDP-N-acetylmuramoyl-tripeptide--D-alanyl-D-alanine ligase [Bdellovibrio sp. ArHS]KHD89203.1 MAG: UDP-N-acetylmuramoylalanyl-D-glutamyl-2, 6-diaminopimelate--D-alanyl-D-alanine ligase [Bdellovibrio sp. ArHS]
MRAMDVQTIVNVTGAQVLGRKDEKFQGLGTDTRADLKGQLFLALKGEAFDAHQFLDKAVQQGATGLLVHEDSELVKKLQGQVTILKVSDTLKALQQLGTWARRQSKAKVLGITGSNGKTTTKEFTAALIGSAKRVHYNKGSFNNHWGVPFTLLQIPADAEVAVVEMGMNHAGELTELVHIAEPDVVVCTMVGRAHMEFFGSIEKVAEAKEEIYEAADMNTLRIYNLDNPQTHNMYVKAVEKKYPREKILTFSSEDPRADVHLTISAMNMGELSIKGSIAGKSGSASVQVFGSQNLTNLMAAASLGLAAGLTAEQVWKGLPYCKTNWGRNQLVNLKSGAQMIFDAYNANPDSMKALIDNMKLLTVPGRKVGVFGQMRELGSASASLHEELGTWVGQAGFDKVYFIGDDYEAFGKGLQKAGYKNPSLIEKDFKESSGQDLGRFLQSGDIAVVKASRGTKLERFVFPCEPLDFAEKQ